MLGNKKKILIMIINMNLFWKLCYDEIVLFSGYKLYVRKSFIQPSTLVHFNDIKNIILHKI